MNYRTITCQYLLSRTLGNAAPKSNVSLNSMLLKQKHYFLAWYLSTVQGKKGCCHHRTGHIKEMYQQVKMSPSAAFPKVYLEIKTIGRSRNLYHASDELWSNLFSIVHSTHQGIKCKPLQ